ncbi:MAG: retroviral-like aspartic protease family protein [Peptococcaceae bacterium]|jgi:predicted aspartyl protease|nr:retroviral-like aspartic protease family protein [Peptococcaceae bacterium]
MNKTVIKMDLTGDLLMLEIGLWSRRTGNFKYALITVDTGASVTTISKEILHQLGYEPMPGDKKRVVTASGVEYVDRFNLEKIKLGSIELPNTEVYGHTFPEESFSLGVLGLNVLKQFDIELLFSKKI